MMPPSRWSQQRRLAPLRCRPWPQERPAHWLPGWRVEGVCSAHTHYTPMHSSLGNSSSWPGGLAGQRGPPAPTFSLDRPQGHLASASSHFVFPPAHSQLVLAPKPLGDLVKVTSFEGAELDYTLGLH